jgi:hypothetical protein
MAGFHRLSQFRFGPTVKQSCMRTGPGGSGVAVVSWSLICSLNAPRPGSMRWCGLCSSSHTPGG